ncbi:MAG: hypothetical protein ABSC55_05105, partial [Syntrophorhabdales bacterium]
MEESSRNDERNRKERDRERQRLYRKRKRKTGKYVNLFVPDDVARKLKRNPGLLVRRFVELSQVMDLLEKQDKEIQEFNSRRQARKLRLSQESENRWIAYRFREWSGQDLLKQATSERYRLQELVAEQENNHAQFRRRVLAILDTAGGLVKKVLDESEEYLNVIHTINKALLNPRIKNERRKALALAAIRQTCKVIIEQNTPIH